MIFDYFLKFILKFRFIKFILKFLADLDNVFRISDKKYEHTLYIEKFSFDAWF